MSESFDSWKGFLDAGFVVQDDGRLRLASGRCGCAVARLRAGLEVRFEPGVSGWDSVQFELPAESKDLWQWAALFARRALGTRERWLCMKQALGKELSSDLAELLDFGFDHLDELPTPETSDKVERMEAKPSASGDSDLVRVRQRLEGLREVAWEELRVATEAHDLVRVKDAAARAEHVDELLAKYGEITVDQIQSMCRYMGVSVTEMGIDKAYDWK